MLVSAIVPTYERAHMLPATLESILAQTYARLEVVVVDDGSTDNTEEVVRGYAARSRLPIKYYRKQNGGCASARNAGVGLAGGECIAFLDSDDQWQPYAVEALVGKLAGTGADFAYSPSLEVMKSGWSYMMLPAAPGDPEQFAREHFLTNRARSCCVLYKRQVFDRFRFSETLRHNEDTDFLQRVAINYKAAYLPRLTATVYQHDSNKSGDRVEIYRALLGSSEAILEEYPEFRMGLGPLAVTRLDEIRGYLVEALVLRGSYGEAVKAARGMRQPLRLRYSIAMHLRSRLPLEAAHLLGRVARKGGRGVMRIVDAVGGGIW